MTIQEMWRRLLWSFVHLGPRRDVTVETLNGLLTFDNKDLLIGKYLFVRRSHETNEIRKVVELLRREGRLSGGTPGGTILNVGANIGMTCIGLMKEGGFARGIAFEPGPNSYRLLVHNIHQNGLDGRVRHFRMALSSSDGEMEFELSEDNSGDHRIRLANVPGFYREENRQTIKVQAMTLDSLLAEDPELRNERVDLVWVDIQGHEGHFFRGARRFFQQRIPVVSEFWPYGIGRSGISQRDYCETLSELFTDFYLMSDEPARKRPISEFQTLFEVYRSPREIGLVVFVSDRQ